MIKKLLLYFLLLAAIPAYTQHTNIMISSNNEPEEPSIYINPHNTQQIVAGSNINNFYFSQDGGYTWAEHQLTSSLYGVWGDPCLLFDTTGSIYFFHLSNPTSGNWIDRIVCQKSNDGGLTWDVGSYMGLNGTKAQDKEWVVVDPATNTMYATWTQFDYYGSTNPLDSSIILFSRSTNQGITWSQPQRLSQRAGDCVDSDNTVEGAVPAIGPEGEIYVAWAGPSGLVFDRSLDGGSAWLPKDIFITDIPGGWDYNVPGISRCNGLPVTCCDVSNSPYRGRIYVNWTDQRNGTSDTDVWLVSSSDGGNTWSEVKRVNNDLPGKQQFFTWMTIDQTTGYLYFVFYDRRNYSGRETDVYMAVSKDGGETFSNFSISETPFTPNANIFFGDYTNISAHNNVIRPIWTRLENNSLSIWTAIINPMILSSDQQQFSLFSLEQNFPNPFSDNTYFSFKIKSPCHVSLKIYDVFGKEIATIINNKLLQTGKYIEMFNTTLIPIASGVYYFSLVSENQIVKHKMLFLR
ncbi:MAG: exo-alpha-sialidase [Lentimicrobiaceae bacterium]|nr:exo-alpha-sialidase [Lentimicrobiaceae bacterium]